MQTHTGGKPYKCTECGVAFVRSKDFLRHMQTLSHLLKRETRPGAFRDTDEEPFKSTECGKTFAQNSDLHGHMQTHILRTNDLTTPTSDKCCSTWYIDPQKCHDSGAYKCYYCRSGKSRKGPITH